MSSIRGVFAANALLAGIVSVALTPSAVFALSWDFETIDSASAIGSVSLAVDSNGYPHLSYYDAANLKYAYYDGTEWHIEVLDEDAGGYYCDTSIALDSSDNPHVVYTGYDGGNNALKYASFNGSGWEFYTIDTHESDSFERSDIAIDSSGNPHIAYLYWWYNQEPPNYSGSVYYYCNFDGSAWDYTYIGYDWGHRGNIAIGLDSYDAPHIVYQECLYTLAPINIVYINGIDWEPEILDNISYGWYTLDIAIDYEDGIHTVYSKGSDAGYAYFDGVTWQLETVEVFSHEVTEYYSIAVNAENLPRFSTQQEVYDARGKHSKFVMYAYFNGYTWSVETVEETSVKSISTSLDSFGNPLIAYIGYRDGDYELILATGHNTAPSSFNLSQPPDGDTVSDTPTLDWEDSTDGDGDTITYYVWYATDPSFEPHEEVTELADSTYTFPEGVLSDGTTYYWKVRATDGWDETWSGPDPYWSFTIEDDVTDVPVTAFSAERARNGVELTWECADPGVGFNLYRSAEATGVHSKLQEMLNAELIVGESPYTYVGAEVSDGVTYSYWLEAIDVGGASETFGPVSCTAGTFVPTAYALYQSRPNPARGTAVIAFDLPEDAKVTLTVYDLGGRKVTTLVKETLPAGAYERPVSGLAPGVYVYRLGAGEFSAARKMVVIN